MKTNQRHISTAKPDCRIFANTAVDATPCEGPPPLPSEIRQKFEMLYAETANLERIVEHVIEKIVPITRPFPRGDCGKNSGDAAKSAQAEISNDIERVAERLASLSNRISETIDALAI